jgi:hypothetical protein
MRLSASLRLSLLRAFFFSRSFFSQTPEAQPRRNSPVGMPTRKARSAKGRPAAVMSRMPVFSTVGSTRRRVSTAAKTRQVVFAIVKKASLNVSTAFRASMVAEKLVERNLYGETLAEERPAR